MKELEINAIGMEQVPNEDGQALYGQFLMDEETVFGSYQSIRDRLVITNKRIIFIDIKGITGKKKNILFIPYSKIGAFTVETAGTIDFDAELTIYLSPMGSLTFNFVRKTDIFAIGKFIGSHVK
jgi:hypothetical protein